MRKENIDKVFSLYNALLREAGLPEVSLSRDIKDQIDQAIIDYGFKNIVTVIEYITKSNDKYSMFMKGKAYNSDKAWLGLRIILNEEKWQDKLNRANIWNSNIETVHDLYIPFRII